MAVLMAYVTPHSIFNEHFNKCVELLERPGESTLFKSMIMDCFDEMITTMNVDAHVYLMRQLIKQYRGVLHVRSDAYARFTAKAEQLRMHAERCGKCVDTIDTISLNTEHRAKHIRMLQSQIPELIRTSTNLLQADTVIKLARSEHVWDVLSDDIKSEVNEMERLYTR
jgi:hypothetical protein